MFNTLMSAAAAAVVVVVFIKLKEGRARERKCEEESAKWNIYGRKNIKKYFISTLGCETTGS